MNCMICLICIICMPDTYGRLPGVFQEGSGFFCRASSGNISVFSFRKPDKAAVPHPRSYKVIFRRPDQLLPTIVPGHGTVYNVDGKYSNSEDAIATVNADEDASETTIYNVAGQRVAQPTKGIYIVGGRKVLYRK